MSNIYDVFNTKNEAEFSKFLDKLNLTTNELLNTVAIAESFNDIKSKQQKILEFMAGTAKGNYEICVEQFKPKFKRVLKENDIPSSQLNLNQIMELNNLVELVANKLTAPNCMKGIFNIIKSKSNANVANAFLGMVQQSSVNDSKLKFNTELQINGQNLAQIIYQLKNDIEIFVNSLECSKKENQKEPVNEANEAKPNMLDNETLNNIKSYAENNGLIYQETVKSTDGKSWLKFISRLGYFNVEQFKHYAKKHFNNIEVKKGSTLLHTHRKIVYITFDMPLNEAEDMSFGIVSQLNKEIDKTNDPKALKIIIQKINDMIKSFKETDTQNILSSLKSQALTKMGELNNSSPKIEECAVQQLVSDVCGEDTFDNLLGNLKPTMISITVNNENGDFEDCYEDLPQSSCEIIANEIENEVQPSSAEAYNALNALSSHLNCQKSDCAENNLEELQSINTLLAQLSNYFNGILSENKIKFNHKPSKLLFENGLRKAGFLNVNTNEIIWLERGEEHSNKLSYNDFDEGWVRFGLSPTKNNPYCYITATNTSFFPKAVKILRNTFKNESIEYYELQLITIGLDDAKIRKVDEKFKPIFEHKENACTASNVSKWLKNGTAYIDDNGLLVLKENCSAGATCAASVGSIASAFKPKKKRKKETLDYSMFKENVSNNIPSSLEINGKNVSYKIIEGKNYLYIGNGILKTTNKQSIMEALDDLYNNCLEMEVLEGFNHLELDLLLEDNMINPTNSTNNPNPENPGEQKQQENELDNQIKTDSNLKVTVNDSNNSNKAFSDQEIVGVDDTDVNNKMYVTKDPITGKIKVVKAQDIRLQGNMQ